ncbi:hypothetical protein AVEN_149627-1 [Araneus ventricosus]|uniref:Uncharacterized protein n=1 Tax=Araneus ventricosus TaxID=182803 RepID=A0A4Y2D8E8_ARAVE|nr:hypothetical protein AVEN_149627-1 [Araneus ventricosus]
MLLQVIDPNGGKISWKTIPLLTLCAGALQKFRSLTLELTYELKMVVVFTRLGLVTEIFGLSAVSDREVLGSVKRRGKLRKGRRGPRWLWPDSKFCGGLSVRPSWRCRIQ